MFAAQNLRSCFWDFDVGGGQICIQKCGGLTAKTLPWCLRRVPPTVDTAFICKTTRKDFFPMTHKDNCGKHGWFIWFIDEKVLLTGWLKNGMGCLSRQWAFMIQGDICMGREVVRSKSFTRWLGSCRDAVLSSKEKWYCTSKSQRKGKH